MALLPEDINQINQLIGQYFSANLQAVKLSTLPLASTLEGLHTMGVDATNNSVRVSLQFVKDATTQASDAADFADQKAAFANGKALLAIEAAGAANAAAAATKPLRFIWDETRLGLKFEGDPDFVYTDLKGATGNSLEFAWNGTQLGVRVEGQPAYTEVELGGKDAYQIALALDPTIGTEEEWIQSLKQPALDAAEAADAARLAIQNDLAAKAAHGYGTEPQKTLKEVDDSVSQLAGDVKEQGEAIDGRISEVEGKIGYSLGWYGIEFDETIANSACTRIGEMDLHRRLPIQNQMRRCLLLDNGKVNYYLHKDDSTKKADGTDAVLDGTDGQVMVEIPAHWRRFEKDGTVHRVKISDFKLEGFHFVPKAYRSAYEATVERSSLKLSSVVNMDVDFRGGNNNADLDGASNTLLGRPATIISGTNFARYAKNRGDRWCMDVYHVKKAMDWLYYIEFANFNSQLPFNPVLTAEGFKQGGLGNGVTNLNSSKWSAFNGRFPFIPMGYTNSLGNKTGVKPFDMPVEYDENIFTTNVPSYRGVENPFGHIWKWADGLKINIQADDAGGESQMYVCENPLLFQHVNYDGYEKRGLLPRANGYISKMIMGDFGDLMPKEAVGGSTTYFADYWYAPIPDSGESQRGVRFGGLANIGAEAGLACSISNVAFSDANTSIGSRLCFLP